MATASNARIQVQAGATQQPLEFLTDDGDQINFSASFTEWALDGVFKPKILPFGVISGGESTPNIGTNDEINISAVRAVMPGASAADANHIVTLAAQSGVALTRAPTLTHIVNSVQLTAAGAISVVVGTEGSSFTEVRGTAAGDMPYILADSVELCQVRFTSGASADVIQAEIKEFPGTTRELTAFPTYESDADTGMIEFDEALAKSHTGDLPKKIGFEGASASYANHQRAVDWVPPAKSFSSNSTPRYGGAEVGESESINQGTVTVFLNDGIGDVILLREGLKTWVKFFPDKDQPSYEICNGTIGFTKSNPADGQIQASMTITAELPARRVPL